MARHDDSTLFLLTHADTFLAMTQLVRTMISPDGRNRIFRARDALQQLEKFLGRFHGNGVTSDESTLCRALIARYFRLFIQQPGTGKEELCNDYQPSARITLPLAAPIPLRATRAELAWLKEMVGDDAFSFLLPDALRAKLRNALSDIPDHPSRDIVETNAAHLDDASVPILQDTLRILWTALTTHRKIAYKNCTGRGRIYCGEAIPVRLQYDCALGFYNLILWTKQRAVKLRVSRLKQVRLKEATFDPSAIQKQFSSFLAGKKEIALLQLHDRDSRNAIIRFAARFEDYDKTIIESEGIFEIKLSYHAFDQQDVLQGILSLGPCLVVKSPESLRADVIRHWKRLQQRLSQLPAST